MNCIYCKSDDVVEVVSKTTIKQHLTKISHESLSYECHNCGRTFLSQQQNMKNFSGTQKAITKIDHNFKPDKQSKPKKK